MPRIDPNQLLKTLGVLLSSHGGIKSPDEVVRIVTLMKKFSKKLVSKCIYVQILKATPVELLDQFLEEDGWSLLNAWFADAIFTKNWPFCLEMIELFNYCPISAERLKDNVENNNAPRLINQLRQEKQVDEKLRQLANQVYNKWVMLVSPEKQARVVDQDEDEDSDSEDEEVAEMKKRLKAPKPIALNSNKKSDSETENGSISLLKSLADEVSESIKKEEKIKDQKSKKDKSDHHRHHSDKKKESKSKDKKDRDQKDERDDKKRKKEDRDKEKERERKRFRVDRRDEVDPSERQRIKDIAKRLKEEEQNKKDKETLSKIGGVGTSSLNKIPKIPKKSVEDQKKSSGGMSFGALLGGLDSKPKTVKTPLNKNKTASLLEGLIKSSSSSSSSSKSSSSSSSSRHHSSSSSRHHSSSHSRRDDKHSKDRESKKEPKSPTLPTKEKPSNLVIPEKRKSVDNESPRLKNNSPHNVAESSGFMDALFSSMNANEPRKKRRRLSDLDLKKAETNGSKSSESPKHKSEKTKEADENKEEETKPVVPAFSFYRDTLETQEEEEKKEAEKPQKEIAKNESIDMEDSRSSSPKTPSPKVENDDDLPFKEPESSLPREVKGILVYHRGRDKRNKKIRWKSETELVAVQYFILDEDERVNVNKIKFENMRDMELKMEKAAIKSKSSIQEEQVNQWYKPKRVLVPDRKEEFIPGMNSVEKDIQSAREKNVLQALYFNKAMTPSTPAEPDPEMSTKTDAVIIPLDDIETGDESVTDCSKMGWPEAKVNQIDRQANFENSFSLPPALSNLLNTVNLNSIIPSPAPLSHDEQETLAAQTEALKALGILPGVDVPPTFPPPNVSVPPTNIPPPMENFAQIPPPNFPPPSMPPRYMAPPPHVNGGFEGGPNFHGGFRGNHRGFHNNGRGFRGGGNGFRGGFRENRDFRPPHHNFKTRPCVFFAKGFCKDGDDCRFIHDGDQQQQQMMV